MKRSTDGGQSWSRLKVIRRGACQPTAVWDWRRDRLLLGYNNGEFPGFAFDRRGAPPFAANMNMASSDLGLTWSAGRSIVSDLGMVCVTANVSKLA